MSLNNKHFRSSVIQKDMFNWLFKPICKDKTRITLYKCNINIKINGT